MDKYKNGIKSENLLSLCDVVLGVADGVGVSLAVAVSVAEV